MTTMRRIYAFTGTHHGMTEHQSSRIVDVFTILQPVILMNGCCEGADRQVHTICQGWDIEFEYHPSTEAQMAWAKTHARRDEAITRIRGPLSRNRVMVRKGVRGLVATPAQVHEVLRSGTWATIREARKTGRPIWIILPTGIVRAE